MKAVFPSLSLVSLKIKHLKEHTYINDVQFLARHLCLISNFYGVILGPPTSLKTENNLHMYVPSLIHKILYYKEDEFENEPVVPKKANVVEDFDDDVEDAIVEDVDSEFNHLLDEEEFEG